MGVGFRMNELFPDGELDGVHRVVDFDELWSGEVTRVIVRSPEHTSAQFHEMVAHLGLDDVTYAVGWTAWMDLAPLGVSKATALERLRRILHVQPHLTVAVGDGHNDVEMLEWAARGVAMGHARRGGQGRGRRGHGVDRGRRRASRCCGAWCAERVARGLSRDRSEPPRSAWFSRCGVVSGPRVLTSAYR